MSTQAPDRTSPEPPRSSPPVPPSPPPRGGPSVGAMTLGVVLIGMGVVALLAAVGVSVPWYAVGPAVLVVVGLGVLVSGIRGEADHAGLGFAIFLGIVLALASFAISVWEVPLAGGVGDRTHEPPAATVLEDDYRWGIGDLTVDLRDITLEPGTTDLEVSVGIGQVEVVVPEGMAVEVDAQVGGGSAEVFGHRVDGVGVDTQRRSQGFGEADARLLLTVRVGLGEAVVTTG